MTNRIKAKKKASRSLGVSLWGRANDPFLKRNYRPGERGAMPRRKTNHAIHLEAKQQIKKHYANINEKQFKNLFVKGKSIKGDTAENFAGLLESRLDTIVYRSNIVPTVFAARQFVSHKHITVNGKVVNIGSYQIKPGDVIQVREKFRKIPMVIESMEKMERDVPAYLEVAVKDMSVKFLNVPRISDIPYPFEANFNLIVEFYSKSL